MFDRIRVCCRDVAASARFVHVREDAVEAYAEEIAPLARTATTYDTAVHFRGSPKETVAYLVTLDAINFGSGYFPHLAKRPGASGYGTIARSLTERFGAQGLIPPRVLARITATDCARIFGQDPANADAAELMSLFARAWNDLGRDLLERFGGSFERLVDAARQSAAALVDLLDRQPLFHDVWDYAGRGVPFFKRSQILASDLALAFDGDGCGRFRDLDSLTIFADNLVPHVLRVDGVLNYHPELLARIERGDLLPAGSEAEVEIRACAVDAAERIVKHLRARGEPVAARRLDAALWQRGQSPRYKAQPRHRTRTTAY